MKNVALAMSKMLEIIKIDEDIDDLRCDINRIRDFKLQTETARKLRKIKDLTRERSKRKHAVKVIIRRITNGGQNDEKRTEGQQDKK
jgi:hypothetical protein